MFLFVFFFWRVFISLLFPLFQSDYNIVWMSYLYLQITRPEESQPEFLVPIQDVIVKEGEAVRFDCQVQALPEASLVWYHQDKPLKSDDIYKIIPGEDGQSALVIAEAFPEDSGTYTVKAVNNAGEVSCSANLTVEGWCFFFDL